MRNSVFSSFLHFWKTASSRWVERRRRARIGKDSLSLLYIVYWCLLKEVQIHDRVRVSLSSFIRQAMSLRECWMREVCARGHHCTAPDHWKRNLFVHPPNNADFPGEVAGYFDEGWPWFQVAGGISAFWIVSHHSVVRLCRTHVVEFARVFTMKARSWESACAWWSALARKCADI